MNFNFDMQDTQDSWPNIPVSDIWKDDSSFHFWVHSCKMDFKSIQMEICLFALWIGYAQFRNANRERNNLHRLNILQQKFNNIVWCNLFSVYM